MLSWKMTWAGGSFRLRSFYLCALMQSRALCPISPQISHSLPPSKPLLNIISPNLSPKRPSWAKSCASFPIPNLWPLPKGFGMFPGYLFGLPNLSRCSIIICTSLYCLRRCSVAASLAYVASALRFGGSYASCSSPKLRIISFLRTGSCTVAIRDEMSISSACLYCWAGG